MREELYKLHYGSYLFLATIDTGAEVGDSQTTLWFREKNPTNQDKQISIGSNWRFLRDFYFDENNYKTIRAFCQQFASDENCRMAALTGATHWARRNALFFRNLLPLLRSSHNASDTSYEQRARSFFSWLDRYTEQILALPTYQHLQTIDNLHSPNALEIDPLILPAVELFNQVPGISTRFSCQGVSGRVRFQTYSLLVVSHHEEFAYISFEQLDYFLHDSLLTLALKFPSILPTPIHEKPMLKLTLHSNGDNIRFRMEIRELAQKLLSHTIRTNYRASSLSGVSAWETACYPALPIDSISPDGILPTRLSWLCEPQRIEETLKYIFFLSIWARASDELFYDDRQELYTIKAAILKHAYLSGSLQPLSYVDCTSQFVQRFHCDLATSCAAEIFLDHLSLLVNDPPIENEQEDDSSKLTQELFRRITGQDVCDQSDIDRITLDDIQKSLLDLLNELITEADQSRQPINITALEHLFIQPTDLLDLSWPYITFWSDLDEQQLRKLDPEGYSLITFQYKSSTADYLFYLPYRFAIDFLSTDSRSHLVQTTEKGREHACYHGRLLTLEERREHPPHEILRILALASPSQFPHKLARKKDRRFATN
jgi:hypothetical protein